MNMFDNEDVVSMGIHYVVVGGGVAGVACVQELCHVIQNVKHKRAKQRYSIKEPKVLHAEESQNVSLSSIEEEEDDHVTLISASSTIKGIKNYVRISDALESFDIEDQALSSLLEVLGKGGILSVVQGVVSHVDVKLKLVHVQQQQLEQEQEGGRGGGAIEDMDVQATGTVPISSSSAATTITIPFSKLCICTGAMPKLVLNHPLVMGLRDTQSVQELAWRLRNARRMVLLGNGGIALGLVHELRKLSSSVAIQSSFGSTATPTAISSTSGPPSILWAIKDSYIGNTFFDASASEFFLSDLVEGGQGKTGAQNTDSALELPLIPIIIVPSMEGSKAPQTTTITTTMEKAIVTSTPANTRLPFTSSAADAYAETGSIASVNLPNSEQMSSTLTLDDAFLAASNFAFSEDSDTHKHGEGSKRGGGKAVSSSRANVGTAASAATQTFAALPQRQQTRRQKRGLNSSSVDDSDATHVDTSSTTLLLTSSVPNPNTVSSSSSSSQATSSSINTSAPPADISTSAPKRALFGSSLGPAWVQTLRQWIDQNEEKGQNHHHQNPLLPTSSSLEQTQVEMQVEERDHQNSDTLSTNGSRADGKPCNSAPSTTSSSRSILLETRVEMIAIKITDQGVEKPGSGARSNSFVSSNENVLSDYKWHTVTSLQSAQLSKQQQRHDDVATARTTTTTSTVSSSSLIAVGTDDPPLPVTNEIDPPPSLQWPLYVQFSNGHVYGCDFIVSATGVVPVTDMLPPSPAPSQQQSSVTSSPLLAEKGVFLRHTDGSLIVNKRMQTTGSPDIYAAGDAAAVLWPRSPNRNDTSDEEGIVSNEKSEFVHSLNKKSTTTTTTTTSAESAAAAAASVSVPPPGAHVPLWFQMRLWNQARTQGSFTARSMAGALDPLEADDGGLAFEFFAHATTFLGKKVVLLGLFNGQGLGPAYEEALRTNIVTSYGLQSVSASSIMQLEGAGRRGGEDTTPYFSASDKEDEKNVVVNNINTTKKDVGTISKKHKKRNIQAPVQVQIRVTPGQEYCKVVLLHGRVVGAMLIGDTDLEETMEHLILNRLDVRRVKGGSGGERKKRSRNNDKNDEDQHHEEEQGSESDEEEDMGEPLDLLDPDIDIEDYFD